jgi:hypothetical protein
MTSTNTRLGRAAVASPTDATSTQPTRDRCAPDQHQQPPRVGRVGRDGQITHLTVPLGGPEPRLGEWCSDGPAGAL